MIIGPEGFIIPLNMAKNDDLLDLLNEIKLRYQIDQRELFGIDDDAIDEYVGDNVAPEKLNFMLQLRLRETEEAGNFLQSILLKKPTERQSWLKNNQQFLEKFNQLLAKNSHWSLMGLKSDQANSALSLDLAQKVKTTMTLVNSLTFSETRLDG